MRRRAGLPLISDRAGSKRLGMHTVTKYLVSLLSLSIGGCSSSSSSNAGATPAGALPCTGLTIDCRAAFADTYSGSYAGSESNTFSINVDILGGIQGSGPGITITGQVDEFGRVTFTTDDGKTFTGQFSSDRHGMSGTWKSSSGSGTWSAQSTTAPTGTGGTGAGGTGSGPSASTVVNTAAQACQKAVTCGTLTAADCPTVNSTTQPDYPQPCWAEELAIYQCINDTACASIPATCGAKVTAADSCAVNNPTYPNNPDFNPPITGIRTFDDTVHLCTACTAEAQACYNSADCKAYSVCVDACPTGDFTCGDNCSTTHPDGFMVSSEAATCQFSNC